MSVNSSTCGIKLLEVTMRDVLDGLEDAASYMNYRSSPEVVEILSIEPPGRPVQSHKDVITLSKVSSIYSDQSSNIVEYLIQRELKRSA